MHQFVLASESPRRRQLLQNAGFVFTVHPVKVSETPDKNLNIDEQILDIARRKARAAFASLTAVPRPSFILLSADTMVVYQDEALGKPESPEEAFRFLRRLSGNTHLVKTALCLMESSSSAMVSQIETSEVRFRSLTDDEIWTYIQSGEPMDKAGAYAIQGLGAKLVESYTGDFNNIVGLPVKALEALLLSRKWTVEKSL
jgi:septum formation protein